MPQTYTLFQFLEAYPDDDACLDRIMRMKVGKDPTCARCKRKTTFYRIRKRRAYECQWCGFHVYPCVGTPFEKSRTSLRKWFYAIYLFTTTRHGVPAKELERQLGVTYKTAWRMGHIIRKLMSRVGTQILTGEVEIDESYVGGRRSIKTGRGRGAANKTIVLGMKQRQGPMLTYVIPDVKRATIEPLIMQHVAKTATVYTDEWWAYRKLRWRGYEHFMVAHGKGEYAKGRVHTNSIENFWARLKLSIRGTHIHVSGKHLQKYLAEFSFRYNYRDYPDKMFAMLVGSVALPA